MAYKRTRQKQPLKRKTLPPLLDEFRTALEEEIESSSRNSSSSAIPLIDGKLIGKAAKSYQYTFKLESLLNTPEDSPGELVIPNRPKIPVTIVSIDGVRIIISVEKNLTSFVPKAWLQTDLSFLMKKLVQRIEDKAEKANPAADRMLGNTKVTSFITQEQISQRSNEKPKLNNGQFLAVTSSMRNNLTAIWGPPGTGKTTTIGEIVINLFWANRSVLIVSHTNTAVDQAILKTAKGIESHLPNGAVVRVGQVSNNELTNKYRDVLMSTQKDRKSEGLIVKHDLLTKEKSRLENEIRQQRKKIEMCLWHPIGQENINQILSSKGLLERTEAYFASLQSKHDTSATKQIKLKEKRQHLAQQLELKKAIDTEAIKIDKLHYEAKNLSSYLLKLEESIEKYTEIMITAERIEPLRKERLSYPSATEQSKIINYLQQTVTTSELELEKNKKNLAAQKAVLTEVKNSNILVRKFKRLPKLLEQQLEVNKLQEQADLLQSEINAQLTAKIAQESKLARIIELDSELAQYRSIGTLADESSKKAKAKHETIVAKRNLEITQGYHKQAEKNLETLHKKADKLGYISPTIKEDYQKLCEELNTINELPNRIRESEQMVYELNIKLNRLFSEFKLAIHPFAEKAIETNKSQAEELNYYLEEFSKVKVTVQKTDIHTVESESKKMETRVFEIEQMLTNIDKKLSELEREIIHEAKVLGATLTKTYLSDDIQGRTFDTVILDEASMAPIPSLWAAASLAKENLILVGDFKQLPPICISKHPMAEKWLKRDIFEVSGLQEAHEQGRSPKHFVPLDQQFRMRSEIADIANLFYGGLLKSDGAPKSDSKQFLEWFNFKWEFDQSPVCFVDTSELHAWATSVPKGDGASRLNFLSATLCIDLAEQILSEERKKNSGGERRVLIVSPYQAHSKLIRLMINQNKAICEEVESGTAHSFQGSEADVVIFDLVIDAPHWRTNLFTPKLDESNKRIYNVAMTRARQRLIIVGNFDWCSKRGKKVFLGRKLLPFIKKNHPIFSAKEVIPRGLAGKAAKAQMSMLGGAIEANSDRLILDQSDFFRALASDLDRANNQIIIFSPFLTKNRVSFLLIQLQAAIERGVTIFVVTKCYSERNKLELQTIRDIENQLQEMGIFIIYKKGMHEKIVLIDDEITWSGSLNPLSFSNTQEIMERRLSKAIQNDYREVLKVEELIGVCGQQEAICPICSSIMVAREGNDEPFYWQCENNDCKYSRSIGAPYPTNGLIKCKTCEGKIEFGEWGGKPHWRCIENRQHRMKIYKSHLKLPKMLELIPEKQQRKVFNDLGQAYGLRPDSVEPPKQLTLFGD